VILQLNLPSERWESGKRHRLFPAGCARVFSASTCCRCKLRRDLIAQRTVRALLGHTKISTALELYTIPIDERRREVVEKLDVLVTNGDESRDKPQDLRMPTTQIQ